MGEELRRRLAEARERRRVSDLISDLRSGNVVTAEALQLVERWGTALEVIASEPLSADEMSRIALEALAETG